jgi:hypothetical protein
MLVYVPRAKQTFASACLKSCANEVKAKRAQSQSGGRISMMSVR